MFPLRPGLDPWRGDIQLPLQLDYEILYIVRPDIEEADLGDVTKKVENLIESLEGNIQRTNVWGKRRLAYEVDHLREGHYVLTDFQIEPARVPEMESSLKISDTVFRHLIVRKPVLKPGAATNGETPAATSELEAAEPEVTEPAAAEPEATEPAAAEPEAAGPEADLEPVPTTAAAADAMAPAEPGAEEDEE